MKKLTWGETKTHSADWMQVRHNLTHGITTGLDPERWSGPLSGANSNDDATRVLQEKVTTTGSKHSLNFWGAISCARLYASGGTHLASQLATHLGEPLDTSKVPLFQDV